MAALLDPREAMVAGVLAAGRTEFAAGAREVALALRRLCEGDLRGMFDGSTSEGIDLDAPLVILDLSAVRDSEALGVLMTCAGAWQQAILRERKESADRDGQPMAKVFCIFEEVWRVASNVGVAEWLQSNFKLCRALGIANWVSLHKLTDFGTAGDDGSRAARIAQALVALLETRTGVDRRSHRGLRLLSNPPGRQGRVEPGKEVMTHEGGAERAFAVERFGLESTSGLDQLWPGSGQVSRRGRGQSPRRHPDPLSARRVRVHLAIGRGTSMQSCSHASESRRFGHRLGGSCIACMDPESRSSGFLETDGARGPCVRDRRITGDPSWVDRSAWPRNHLVFPARDDEEVRAPFPEDLAGSTTLRK
ncbi:MAG: hypothetical protein QM729_03805 [Solirubrobacterales bacterium]